MDRFAHECVQHLTAVRPQAGSYRGDCGSERQEIESRLQKIVATFPRAEKNHQSHVQLGIQLEENARCSYEFDTDSEVEQVAFVHDESGKWGFSPDGLVGTDGGVEIKVPQLDTHLKYLDMAVIPVEYRAQVWAPLLMGWQWWDFYSYSRFESVPHFLIRAHAHDEDFIAWKAAMGEYFPQFLERLDAMRHSVGLGPLDHPTDKHLERYDGSTSIDTTSVTMFEGHAVTYW